MNERCDQCGQPLPITVVNLLKGCTTSINVAGVKRVELANKTSKHMGFTLRQAGDILIVEMVDQPK